MTAETKKKALKKAIAIAALLVMLAITTLALLLSFVQVDNNDFQTGVVNIELNDGKPVFDGSDSNIEPNHTLVKDFTVTNKGTADAYYRLYLHNIEGKLRDSLNFKIYEGDTLLYDGDARELTKANPCVSHKILAKGETRKLTAVVNMKKESGNEYQKGTMVFDITVDAVQSKNNPDKKFD